MNTPSKFDRPWQSVPAVPTMIQKQEQSGRCPVCGEPYKIFVNGVPQQAPHDHSPC